MYDAVDATPCPKDEPAPPDQISTPVDSTLVQNNSQVDLTAQGAAGSDFVDIDESENCQRAASTFLKGTIHRQPLCQPDVELDASGTEGILISLLQSCAVVRASRRASIAAGRSSSLKLGRSALLATLRVRKPQSMQRSLQPQCFFNSG